MTIQKRGESGTKITRELVTVFKLLKYHFRLFPFGNLCLLSALISQILADDYFDEIPSLHLNIKQTMGDMLRSLSLKKAQCRSIYGAANPHLKLARISGCNGECKSAWKRSTATEFVPRLSFTPTLLYNPCNPQMNHLPDTWRWYKMLSHIVTLSRLINYLTVCYFEVDCFDDIQYRIFLFLWKSWLDK